MKALIGFVLTLGVAGGVAGCASNDSSAGNGSGKSVDASQLISRDVLFGNPDKAQARVSYDGKQIAFVAPVDGVMNVWVGPASNIDKAKPVTKDTKRGIRQYQWTYTNQHLLYLQDDGGNENWNIHVVDLNSGDDKNLTPNPKVTARIGQLSPNFPDEIIVGMNERNPMFHDLYRINVKTGASKMVVQHPGQINGVSVAGLVADEHFRLRFAQGITAEAEPVIFKPEQPVDLRGDSGSKDIKWVEFAKIPFDDAYTTGLVGFDESGDTLYFRDSRERDTSALFAWNLKTNEKKLLAEHPKADFGGAMTHPKTQQIQAVAFNYDRVQWKVIDEALKADFEYLKKASPGEMSVTSRSLDDKWWTVAYVLDNGPARTYLYDRENKKATLLFVNKKSLEGLPLVKMHPVVVKSRDGLDLVCYYSLPLSADSDQDGKPEQPVPFMLNIHGGPWARDSWGFDPEHQWLANRGYGVMSINYRGSTGFGKKFVNASNKEWAGKMHDDLLDAVDWVVKNKIADPEKVGIMGGSYGGYATLVGLTFTPDVFACGVDIVGPSNLNTLLASVPPYWKPMVASWHQRVGNPETSEGKEFLDSRSPLTFVEKIKKPLLIGQGANDPRVKQPEADQIVKAMTDKNIPVTYVLYPDEGHGFARPENRISFYAVAEAFLAKHMGGRAEPIGDDFKGSSIDVKAGAEQVPGLENAPKPEPAKRAS